MGGCFKLPPTELQQTLLKESVQVYLQNIVHLPYLLGNLVRRGAYEVYEVLKKPRQLVPHTLAKSGKAQRKQGRAAARQPEKSS